ncbi:cell wall hydrolase, partial [Streptomyces sp. NPDC048483]
MTSPSDRQIPLPCGPHVLARLPEAFRNVSYSGARHPGAGAPECPLPTGDAADGLAGGANCQRYAYAVLRHFGLRVPPLRSAELWADASATVRVGRPRPLDLV